MLKQCPKNWKPGCICSIDALEPHDDCYTHGFPDTRRCPYCGQIRGNKSCRRCGCSYGLYKEIKNNGF